MKSKQTATKTHINNDKIFISLDISVEYADDFDIFTIQGSFDQKIHLELNEAIELVEHLNKFITIRKKIGEK